MDDNTAVIIAFVAGVILGFLIALAIFLMTNRPLGVVFERDEKGLIRAVYQVPVSR